MLRAAALRRPALRIPAINSRNLAILATVGILVYLVIGPLLNPLAPWLKEFPDQLVLPITGWFNQFMVWFVAIFGVAFQVITDVLVLPIRGMQALLNWLPWPLTIGLAMIVAHRASGWKLALATAAGMFYMVAVDYWTESMNTLSMVAITVPLSVAVGFAVGFAVGISSHGALCCAAAHNCGQPCCQAVWQSRFNSPAKVRSAADGHGGG